MAKQPRAVGPRSGARSSLLNRLMWLLLGGLIALVLMRFTAAPVHNVAGTVDFHAATHEPRVDVATRPPRVPLKRNMSVQRRIKPRFAFDAHIDKKHNAAHVTPALRRSGRTLAPDTMQDAYRVSCARGKSAPAVGAGVNPARRQKRYAIVTIAAPGAFGVHRRSSMWMTNFTIVNKERYARHRGYDLHVHGLTALDHSLPPSWSKIKLLRRHVIDYDYVMWVDADVLFTNFDKGIEDLVNLNPYKEVMIARDDNGLNCGVMVLQGTSKVAALLDEVWYFSGDRNHMWQEQYALSEVLKKRRELVGIVAEVEQRSLNSYARSSDSVRARWHFGDMLVHFANCDSRPHACFDDFRFHWRQWTTNTSQRVTRRDTRHAGPMHLIHV
jgi:hypothetical protein